MSVKPIKIIGVPWDEKSSFMHGCKDAPGRIWEAFSCDSANTTAENGVNLGDGPGFSYRGNMVLSSGDGVVDEITAQAEEICREDVYPFFLGGDHAVSYPLVRALAKKYPGLNILHFDAHPDLYDNFDGDKYSHACPFARIMEGGLAKRLVSVGVRTMVAHQREQAERLGVEIIDMMNFDPQMILAFDGPVYLSLDLDVLDPAFAPGISHHEPGGLTTRELIRLIQIFQGKLVAADIVEYNPYRDIQNMTAMLAAKLMKEIASRFGQ